VLVVILRAGAIERHLHARARSKLAPRIDVHGGILARQPDLRMTIVPACLWSSLCRLACHWALVGAGGTAEHDQYEDHREAAGEVFVRRMARWEPDCRTGLDRPADGSRPDSTT
jgi:hypothetical protein